MSKLRLEVKPRLGVVATASFKPGELVLIPLSTGIVHATGKVPSAAVTLLKDDKAAFYVANTLDTTGRQGKQPFVNPFWAVKKVADSAVATMVLDTATAHIQTWPEASAKSKSTSEVKILVMKNQAAVSAGDHLTLHEKAKYDIGIEDVVPPAKKQRR